MINVFENGHIVQKEHRRRTQKDTKMLVTEDTIPISEVAEK